MSDEAHAEVVDCPFAPGTPEHSEWVKSWIRSGTAHSRDRDAVGSGQPVRFAAKHRAAEWLAKLDDADIDHVIILIGTMDGGFDGTIIKGHSEATGRGAAETLSVASFARRETIQQWRDDANKDKQRRRDRRAAAAAATAADEARRPNWCDGCTKRYVHAGALRKHTEICYLYKQRHEGWTR